jgi:hypothetical protein
MQNFEYANTFTKFQSVFELQPWIGFPLTSVTWHGMWVGDIMWNLQIFILAKRVHFCSKREIYCPAKILRNIWFHHYTLINPLETLWRLLSPFGEPQLYTLPPPDSQTDLESKLLLNFWWIFYSTTTPLQWRNFSLSFKTSSPGCFIYLQNCQVCP